VRGVRCLQLIQHARGISMWHSSASVCSRQCAFSLPSLGTVFLPMSLTTRFLLGTRFEEVSFVKAYLTRQLLSFIYQFHFQNQMIQWSNNELLATQPYRNDSLYTEWRKQLLKCHTGSYYFSVTITQNQILSFLHIYSWFRAS